MISIILPLYNEEEIIDEMVNRLNFGFSVNEGVYEFVFVDDGSIDRSVYKLLKLGKEYPCVKALGWSPLGWSSTTISIYFLGSIQLTFMGVLGEYTFRIYKELQNRLLYFIKDVHE